MLQRYQMAATSLNEAGNLVTDNELIGKYIFKNDNSAFEELVRRHSNLVMGVCRGMLLQTQDAEDAFQATFLILSRKCKSLLDHGSVAGWLYQTAVRNCLQIRRRKSRTRETEMTEEPFKSDEPWLQISQAQERDLVYQAINRLPRHYREAIVLCHLNGHTRAEAAELLDSTEASIKAALSRGRNLLRKRLVRSGIFTVAILAALRTSTSNASQHVSEPLVSSALQLANGLSPTTKLGTSSQFVQTLASQGIMSMNSTIILKSVSSAAAILLAITIPVVVYAQQTKIQEQNPVAIVQTGDDIAQVQEDSANVKNSEHTVKAALVKFDRVSSQDSKLPPAQADPIGTPKKSAEPATPANHAPVGRYKGPASKISEGVFDPFSASVSSVRQVSDEYRFSIKNSAEYWKLMLKSYELRRNALKEKASNSQAPASERMLHLAESYELGAKVIEAELNITRIEHEKANPKPPTLPTETTWNASEIAPFSNPLNPNGSPSKPQPPSKAMAPVLSKSESRSDKIKSSITELRLQLSKLEPRFGPGHPDITNLKEMIAVLEKELVALDKPKLPPASTDPVKPGEVLTVESMTDPGTINRRVTVLADYTISLPLIRNVNVRGMTTDDVAETLDKKYSKYLKEPAIFVGREAVSSPLKR